MRLRTALAAATLLSLLAPGAADAATRRVSCNLVVDGEGDGGSRIVNIATRVNSPPMDILVADFATGARTVVARIKVKSFDLDAQAAPAWTYHFYFTIGTTEYEFSADRNALGNTAYDFSSGAVTGAVDLAAATITWTTARSNVGGLRKARQRVTNLRAATNNFVSNSDVTSTTPDLGYVDRTPSCLRPA